VTDPGGGSGVPGWYAAELDAAVAHARRVAAQARAAGAEFRGRTAALAGREPGATVVSATSTGATVPPDALRRAAAGFRADHGLPVRERPPAAGPGPDGGRDAPVPADPEVLPGRPEPVRARRSAPPEDDDEDFSQQRILS
jgi:hypothetical protein